MKHPFKASYASHPSALIQLFNQEILLWPHNEYGKHLNYFVDEVHVGPQSKDHIKRSKKRIHSESSGLQNPEGMWNVVRARFIQRRDSAPCHLKHERSALPPEVKWCVRAPGMLKRSWALPSSSGHNCFLLGSLSL